MMLIYDYEYNMFAILNEDKECVDEFYFKSKNLTLPFSKEIDYFKEECDADGDYTGDYIEEVGTIIPLNALNTIRMVFVSEHNCIMFNQWLKDNNLKDQPKYLMIGERHELMEFSPRRQ